MALKSFLRSAFFDASRRLGVNALFRSWNRKSVVVMYYHGICDDASASHLAVAGRHLPREVFRSHLEYFRELGFHFVSLTEACEMLEGKRRFVGKPMTLTFDDGFANVVRNAYPLMREFEAKGCLYAVADLVGTDGMFWTDWLANRTSRSVASEFRTELNGKTLAFPLTTAASRRDAFLAMNEHLAAADLDTQKAYVRELAIDPKFDPPDEYRLSDWDQLQGLDPEILDVGSHTCSHPNLASLTDEDSLDDEIRRSKEVLESGLGRRVDHFCYPAGWYDQVAKAKVAECAYVSATTTRHGRCRCGDDLFVLRRVAGVEDFRNLEARVCGTFAAYEALSTRFRDTRAQRMAGSRFYAEGSAESR